MNAKSQSGYLVLADISGYTSFLAKTELEHAHEIISDLLEIIVNTFQPLLTLSKLEGDAVFAYSVDTNIMRGETLLELLENTYFAFRQRIANSARHTTCTCAACSRMPTLDLKFIVHHGTYILQTVAGITEVVGSDVNLAHRLMKNHVVEETGWKAYSLISAAAVEKLQISTEGMTQVTENYEHLGDVLTYNIDLHARFEELKELKRVEISAKEAQAVIEFNLPVPPAVAWQWLHNPNNRSQWMPGTLWKPATRAKGRTGAGSSNHCFHGKDFHGLSVEQIVDWHPFDYCTSIMGFMQKPVVDLWATVRLVPIDSGTKLVAHAKCTGQLPGFMARFMARMMAKKAFAEPWMNLLKVIEASQSTAVPQIEMQMAAEAATA